MLQKTNLHFWLDFGVVALEIFKGNTNIKYSQGFLDGFFPLNPQLIDNSWYIPWNLFILYKQRSFGFQVIIWVCFLCSAPFHEPSSPVLTFAFKHLQPAFFESLKVDLERSIDHLRFPADFLKRESPLSGLGLGERDILWMKTKKWWKIMYKSCTFK